MAPSLIDLLFFICFLISVPVYCLFLHTIVKNRTKSPFNSAFFKISLSLGISDITMLFLNNFLMKFSRWNWITADLVRKFPHGILPQIALQGCITLAYVQDFGVVLLSLNRFTALSFPMRQKVIWSSTRIRAGIIIQWLVPFLMMSPMFFITQFTSVENNRTGGIDLIFENVAIFKYYFLFSIIFGALTTVMVCIFYLYGFCSLRRSSKRVSEGQGDKRPRRREVKLAFAGLIILAVKMSYVTFSTLMTVHAENAELVSIYVPLAYIIADVYSWINPYAILIMCTEVRKQFFKNWPFSVVVKKNNESRVIEMREERNPN